VSFLSIDSNDQRLKEEKKTTEKGFSYSTPGLDLLRTAPIFSGFRELIKLIRRERKPRIRVPQSS